MKDNLKLEIQPKLKQKLKLTTSMKMSLKLLSLSSSNLKNFVEKEIYKNFQIDVNFKNNSFSSSDEKDNAEFDLFSNETSFFDFLEEQISYLDLDKKIKDICLFIINNINEKGYLEISKLEIKNILGINNKELNKSFDIIYSLEPYGVGAYCLEESLILQLKIKNIHDEKLFLFIEKYLYLLADKRYQELMEILNISKEKLDKYIQTIQSLNPKITRGFKFGDTRKIIPDVYISINDNKISYEINRELFPQINISQNDNNLKKINEIISCIEKRYETLDKIVNIIIAKQENFFLTKGKILNTLKELEVAKELNISPSTVSRAINEKYIKTNFGVISLKKLFPKNTENIDIQNIIMKLIEQENKNFPYTDEELVNLLKKSNFFVARRTVTKYRNLLGYKSSRQRKRT